MLHRVIHIVWDGCAIFGVFGMIVIILFVVIDVKRIGGE